MNQMKTPLRVITIVVALGLLTGCAGKKLVPMTIQSDPLGAYVAYQIRTGEGQKSDWIFLGKTPIDINRSISRKRLRKAQAFSMKVMKEGYSDQVKELSGKDLLGQIQSKGRVFWNPRLVPSN